MELNQISLADAAAARLIQIGALNADLAESDLDQRGAKRKHLGELLESTREWSGSVDLPDYLTGIQELSHGYELGAQIDAVLASHATYVEEEEELVAVLIEAAFGTDWPKGSRWTIDRADAIHERATTLDPGLTPEDVRSVIDALKRSTKRLQKDSVSVQAQFGMATFMAAGAVLSGGAANAVGTAVGTHILGLSGAAATSAGLAFLGGGSLAAGGLGMAGGKILVGTAAYGVRSASKALLGAVIAKSSSAVFIGELAKLDVLVSLEPELHDTVLDALVELRRAMRHELVEVEGTPEAKNLAKSARAVDFEIRHLKSPQWKRMVSKGTRVLGLPGLSTYLDRF